MWRGLGVISAGFREVSAEGAARECELVEIVHRYGMRMVGPNCMGVLNTDPGISMNATFAPSMPPFGRAAFVIRRRNDRKRPHVGLYFEDGSMVSLPDSSPQAVPLLDLGREAVGLVRS